MHDEEHTDEIALPKEQADAAPAESPSAPDPQVEGQRAGQPDVMPDLKESLRLAELKAEEHHDAWLRAKAETENVRRRSQEEIAKATRFAGEKFAQAMLPVKDSLEAALAAEGATLESLRTGVELTLKQLESAFSGASIREENPRGARFDPNLHQAISMIEAEGEPNTVIDVLQKGYVMSERVIRPAMVVVSKAKSA